MSILSWIAIRKKWARDKQVLPLSAAHWSLYEIIHKLFLKELGCFPDLVNCPDYNSKIQWLKLFAQDPRIVTCTDKLLVRDFVKERLGDGFLPKLYQVADSFDQINFDALPGSFVLKTNHDSGSVILVRNKQVFDIEAAESQMTKSLKRVYGKSKGEWTYKFVRPKIFLEEFLGDPSAESPPPDYKFHCVNGKVRWLQYIYDRGFDTKELIFSPNGDLLPVHFDRNLKPGRASDAPENFYPLIGVAEKLSEGFKYVRVDLYFINRRIYVGELTFFPLKGTYGGDGQKELGKLLDFDRNTFLPPMKSVE